MPIYHYRQPKPMILGKCDSSLLQRVLVYFKLGTARLSAMSSHCYYYYNYNCYSSFLFLLIITTSNGLVKHVTVINWMHGWNSGLIHQTWRINAMIYNPKFRSKCGLRNNKSSIVEALGSCLVYIRHWIKRTHNIIIINKKLTNHLWKEAKIKRISGQKYIS